LAERNAFPFPARKEIAIIALLKKGEKAFDLALFLFSAVYITELCIYSTGLGLTRQQRLKTIKEARSKPKD